MSEGGSVSIVDEIKSGALDELRSIDSLEQLETWRIAYLGRRGQLTQVLRSLGSASPEERRQIGAAANQVKTILEESLAEREQTLKQAELTSQLENDTIDVTLPGWPVPQGSLHPITLITREICAAFTSMGFDVAEGPEVEWDHYNFELLNIPRDHPARDNFNTLWIDYEDENGERPLLLRTHTSPMQARIMEKAKPPVRVIVPGKCYRYEATDATHEWQDGLSGCCRRPRS